jgi:hypothetical protein
MFTQFTSAIWNNILEVPSCALETAREFAPEKIRAIENFAGSVIGKQVVATGLGVVGNSVGMAVGTAFPELTVAYGVGGAVNEKYGKVAGVGAALTVGALGMALSALTTGDGTIAQTTQFMLTSAGSIVGGMTGIKASGQKVETPQMIFNSRMEAAQEKADKAIEEAQAEVDASGPDNLDVAQKNFEVKKLAAEKKCEEEQGKVTLFDAAIDSYPMRTAQYLVATQVVNALPIAPIAQVVVGVAAGVMAAKTSDSAIAGVLSGTTAALLTPSVVGPVGGLAGYYAEDLADLGVKIYNRKPDPINYFDPGEMVRAQVEGQFGSSEQMSAEMAQNLKSIPVIGRLLGYMTQGALGKAVGQKVVTNTLVRTLDEYLSAMKEEDMEKLTADFMKQWEKAATPDEKKQIEADCRKGIYNKMINKEGWIALAEVTLGRWMTKEALRTEIETQVDAIAAQLEEKQIELIGQPLTATEKSVFVLKAHLYNYVTLAMLRMQGTLISEVKELEKEEITGFYKNINHLFFSQYQGSLLGDSLKSILDKVIPTTLQYGGIVPKMIFKTQDVALEEFDMPESELSIDEFETISSESELSIDEFEQIPAKQVEPQNPPVLRKSSFFAPLESFFKSLWESLSSIFVKKLSPQEEMAALRKKYKL